MVGSHQRHNPFMAQAGNAGELVRYTQAPVEQKKYLKFKIILILPAMALCQSLNVGEESNQKHKNKN